MQDPTVFADGEEDARLALALDDPAADNLIAEGAIGPGDGAIETFDLELDGEVHTLPLSLKGAFLRQADYTRKTQELAEGRRSLEAERAAADAARRAYRGALSDRAVLAALEEQVEALEGIDWRGLAEEDPERAKALWSRYEETQALREDLVAAIEADAARDEALAAREAAQAMAETGARLREEIDGWSPEVAAKLVEYGQAFGVTLEELAQMADPRLWKLLHKAWTADESARSATTAQVRSVQPAVTLAGGGAGGGVLDELGTKEWMRRRNAQSGR